MADFVECANCHRKVSAGLTWCAFCGEELVSAAEPATESEEFPGEDDVLDTTEVFESEPEPFDDEPFEEPFDDELVVIDPDTDPDACSSCGRTVDPRLHWCPHCGTERETPAAAAPSEPDPEDLPPPPEGLEEPPLDLPPPSRRRADTPLGVEGARPLPDLDSEARRVRRSQIAGMVMSIVLIIGSVAFVVFLLVSLLGGDDGDAISQGTTPSGVFVQFTPVSGDCVGYAADGEITEEPCSVPHDGEVFAAPVYTPSDAAFPGEAAITAYAADRCFAEFEGYVGIDYYASGLTFTYVTPSAEAWADGSRRMLCILEDPFGGTIDVPLRNSGGVDHPGYVPFSLLTSGTCWDFTDDTAELVPVVDCAAPHDVETFAAFDYPATEFPGNEAAQQLGAQECSRRLTEYAADVDETVDYWAATPTGFDWPLGYRIVVCSVYRPDGVKLTGSLAG